ncbi:MAG: ABC transporter ATP-binding protein [Oscillospiraceae bacterium]|nr:ABC transporter ATP-binding protein [Oscillospiraceae bacterium]
MEGTSSLTRTRLALQFLKGSKRFFALGILLASINSVIELVIPRVISFTVDSVIGTKDPDLPRWILSWLNNIGGAAYLRRQLWIVAVIVVSLAACAALCSFSQRVSNATGAETLVKRMRDMIFRHIEHLPFAWHMKNQTGDIIQRCTSDVDTVKRFLAEQLPSLFRVALLLVMGMIFMIRINLTLSLVAIFTLPIVSLYSAVFHKKIGEQFQKVDENEGLLSTICQENLTGVRVVRAFGREKYECERFGKQNNIFSNLNIRLTKLMSAFWGVGDLITGMQRMLIIVLGSYICVKGKMTAGEFIAFISYNTILTWPIRMLGRMVSEMSKAGISFDRILYIMRSPLEQDKPDAQEPDMNKDISFEHVTFQYLPDVPVVRDVSFTIPAGSVFGILGNTGSGKSTIMYLLDRLYDLPPEQGRITIGGVDVADMKASWVRKNIGIVLQEPFLFSRTIAENISIGRNKLDMRDVRKASATACLDEAIENFTQGYDTFVGERGVTMSGGQKQRTAIARMLMQNAPILVFDDSLSAVDAETDAKIRHALKENMHGATMILISHRITTLMQADRILVLDNGQVAELGTHQELMERNGIYRRVYDIQMAPEELEA